MNDAMKEFRLIEIAPVKHAMMNALCEAVKYRPILMRRGEGPFLVDWDELELSIVCLSRTAHDDKLRELCDKFIAACKEATDLYLSCPEDLKKQGVDISDRRKIVEEYKKRGADEKIRAIKLYYRTLTDHLEAQLA